MYMNKVYSVVCRGYDCSYTVDTFLSKEEAERLVERVTGDSMSYENTYSVVEREVNGDKLWKDVDLFQFEVRFTEKSNEWVPFWRRLECTEGCREGCFTVYKGTWMFFLLARSAEEAVAEARRRYQVAKNSRKFTFGFDDTRWYSWETKRYLGNLYLGWNGNEEPGEPAFDQYEEE